MRAQTRFEMWPLGVMPTVQNQFSGAFVEAKSASSPLLAGAASYQIRIDQNSTRLTQ